MNSETSDAAIHTVALAADLLFASRIRATAAQAGVAVHLARSAADLVERAAALPARLVLIDLDARLGNPVDAIRALKDRPGAPTVVAFASHTDAGAIAAARDAGADRVLARSAFVRELPGLLRSVVAPGS